MSRQKKGYNSQSLNDMPKCFKNLENPSCNDSLLPSSPHRFQKACYRDWFFRFHNMPVIIMKAPPLHKKALSISVN